jgi:histone H3/H4
MTEKLVEEALSKCSLFILKSAGIKQIERLALSSFASFLSEYLLKLINDLKCICNHPARLTPNAFDFKLLFTKRKILDAKSISSFVSMRRFVCDNLMIPQDKKIVSRVQDSSLPPLPPLHSQRFTKVFWFNSNFVE